MKSFFAITAPLLAFVLTAAGSPTSNAPDLVKRDTATYCGNFGNADGTMIKALNWDLGRGDLKNRDYVIPAGGCNRVQCWDTSAIYACNDNTYDLTLKGETIRSIGKYVLKSCCFAWADGTNSYQKGIGGHQFTGDGWNVVIGYGSCKHDIHQPPSTIGGVGINGSCEKQAFGIPIPKGAPGAPAG